MQHTILTKADIPEDPDEKKEFAKKLMTYGVSLMQYSRALKKKDIK